MKKFVKDKRIVYIYIVVLILLGLGFSYALQTTSSLSLTTGIVKIDEKAYGNTSFDSSGVELEPILDKDVEEKKDNIIKIDFTVGGASSNNTDAIYDIALSDLRVNCNLLSPYLKWKLVKNNEEISSGSLDYHFDTIDEYGRMVLTNVQQDLAKYSSTESGYDQYSFYLWLSDSCQNEDISKCSNYTDQSSLMGQTFSGKIEVELNTGSKKELVRSPSSAVADSMCNNRYLVNYSTNGGVVTGENKYVVSGESYGELATPTREYQVTFDTNGGSNLTGISNTLNKAKLKLLANENIKSVSYTFLGWYLDKSYTKKVDSNTIVDANQNVTLYAKWDDSNAYVTLPSVSKDGYQFLGWYTDKNGGSKLGGAGDKIKLSKDTTIYARWEVQNYKISYNLNKGVKGSSAPEEGSFGKVIQISNPTKTVTITGDANGTGATVGSATSKVQTFAGWTASNLNTSSAYYGSSEGAVNTLWSDGSTKVTSTYFKDLGLTGNSTVTLTANWTAVAVTTPTLTKTGYTCTWNTASNGSGDSYNPGASYTPSTTGGNVTLYARCSANTYTITYNAQNNIINPDTSRWEFQGNSKLQTTYQHNGQVGAAVYSNIGQFSGLRVPLNDNKKKNTNYQLSLWGYRTSDFDGYLRAYTETYDASNTVISYNHGISFANDNLTINSWRQLSYSFNSGDWTSWNQINIDYSVVGQGPVYVSDIRLDEYSAKTLTYGNTLGTLPTPTRNGYTFAGWYTSASGGAQVSSSTAVPSDNTTYYAHWTANKYTVTLDNQGATSAGSTSVTATYGSAMPSITKPTRNYTVTYNANGGSVGTTSSTVNYTFNGYYTSVGGGGTQYYNSSGGSTRFWNLGSNTTLYASWSTASVTLPTPSWTGHTFDGWYTASAGGTKVGDAGGIYTPTSTLTLYAHWTQITFNVDTNPVINGTTYGAGLSGFTYNVYINGNLAASNVGDYWATVPYGGTLRLVPNGVTGYSATEASRTNITNNTALTGPYWNANTYTVTYDNNGGSGCGSRTINYGSTYGSLCTPTRTGYTFVGWYTAGYKNAPLNYYADTYSDLKNAFGYDANSLYSHWINNGRSEGRRVAQYMSSDTFSDTSNITIYAGWIANTYTIIYDNNGGSGCGSKTVTYNSTYGDLCSSSRTGYKFVGWYTAGYKDAPLNYYADTYSDLKNAFGYDANSLYSHWINNGRSEGRRVAQYMSSDTVNITSNTTIYAGWNINTVCVQFHMNGGYLKSNHGAGISTSGSLITLNGSTCVKTYTYGETGIDLPNNNNDGYINLARSGYKSYTGQEWCTSASGGTCYNQTNANISANNLCNLAAGNCTVTLYAHWKKN